MPVYRDIAIADQGEGAFDGGRKYVVAIGIDRYRHWSRLHNAVRDAQGALRVFENLGFVQACPPLLNEDATERALRHLVSDKLRLIGPGDSLVLFYAGHGYTEKTKYAYGEPVKTGYLIPVDGELPNKGFGTWVRADSWLSDIARLLPQHIYVILDACHSGIALTDVVRFRGNYARLPEPLRRAHARRSRLVLTSALDDEQAMDNGPVHGHSLFTGCLIEALDGGVFASLDRSVVTGTEVSSFVRSRVTEFPGARQSPGFGGLELHDNGDMLLELPENGASLREQSLSAEVIRAFLSARDLFNAIQHPHLVFETDPFDVESIHGHARQTFERLIEQAIHSETHEDEPNVLLMLGDSGSGKTHLLRAFRRHVHERGMGFVAYAQPSSLAKDYSRYLLHHVVDSLARPYSGGQGERTGLRELASGVSELAEGPLRIRIKLLEDERSDIGAPLLEYIDKLTEELVCVPELSQFDPHLLRVLLFALRPDAHITAGVYRYLRCENMNDYDHRWLGNAVPHIGNHEPSRMICDLARLVFVTRGASLVFLLDDQWLPNRDQSSEAATFARSIQAIFDIAHEVPSVVGIATCLSDLYAYIRPQLDRRLRQTLERTPPVRLQSNCTYAEIVEIVSRRLSWLFADIGIHLQANAPTYPIPESALRTLAGRRPRDVLQWCREFQILCATAGTIINEQQAMVGIAHTQDQISDKYDLDEVASAWDRAVYARDLALPVDDEEILSTIELAAMACADEVNLSLKTISRGANELRLRVAGTTGGVELSIGVANAGPQGGAFSAQIEALRRRAGTAIPVALRTTEFPSSSMSARTIANLLKSGGRRIYIDGSTLRSLAALKIFNPDFPADRVALWRHRDRPISTLSPITEIFDLPQIRFISSVEVATSISNLPSAPQTEAPSSANVVTRAPAASTADRPSHPQALHLSLGISLNRTGEVCAIDPKALLKHTCVIGDLEEDQQNLSLHLIEQILERGIAVIVVDSTGSYAGYGNPNWWVDASITMRAIALATQLDVRLFTPGEPTGRPLSIPVLPELSLLPEHMRDWAAIQAAESLAALMRLGEGVSDAACRAVLVHAMFVLAERKVTDQLEHVITLIKMRDDALVARVGRHDDRLFTRLVHELEAMRIKHEDLFDSLAEPLNVETLIGGRVHGKTPLAVVNLQFLGDLSAMQAWSTYFITALNQNFAISPSSELRAVFVINEADLFLPANTTNTYVRKPLQELLRRARAVGLGVILASHRPSSVDYSSWTQVSTCLLGRLMDPSVTHRMTTLKGLQSTINNELAALQAEQFIVIDDDGMRKFVGERPLLSAGRLSESELISLAALSLRQARQGGS